MHFDAGGCVDETRTDLHIALCHTTSNPCERPLGAPQTSESSGPNSDRIINIIWRPSLPPSNPGGTIEGDG